MVRTILSTIVLVLQGMVLGSMNYSALDWQYWAIMLLTILYMFIYKFMDDQEE